MNKKSFFIICSTLIIASNLLMISVVNKGEETGSNLFVIAIACVMLPAFLYAVENQLTSLIRVESILLIQLAVISLLRLINRIGSTPEILNIIITLLVFCRWDSLYPCCNHENLSEQTEVRVNSFRCIFTLLNSRRASMFFMLAF